MKFNPLLAVPVTASIVIAASPIEIADAAPAERVQNATVAFRRVISDPDKRIPPGVLRQSQAVVIMPNMVQAGFLFGGRRGEGVLLVRNANGQWSDPAFVNITGGSFGLQVGASSSDVVMVFMDRASLSEVVNDDFTLGGKVAGVGGPVGVSAVSPADSAGKVYTYARSEGLFGGVALEGAKLAYDKDANSEFYRQPDITLRQVLTTQRRPAPAVTQLRQALNQAQR
jgi:SH3 domain-containing YSC84-like protein 1